MSRLRSDWTGPLTAAGIDDFARSLPCPLPGEVRELLQVCRGFRGGYTEAVDFTGGLSFELETLFPYGLPIAADGYGNFWVVDLMPGSTEFGPIYYACHDAPVILYQSSSLSDFLTELFKMCSQPHESLIDDVHEDRLYHVWRTNPGALSYEAVAIRTTPHFAHSHNSLTRLGRLRSVRRASWNGILLGPVRAEHDAPTPWGLADLCERATAWFAAAPVRPRMTGVLRLLTLGKQLTLMPQCLKGCKNVHQLASP